MATVFLFSKTVYSNKSSNTHLSRGVQCTTEIRNLKSSFCSDGRTYGRWWSSDPSTSLRNKSCEHLLCNDTMFVLKRRGGGGGCSVEELQSEKKREREVGRVY